MSVRCQRVPEIEPLNARGDASRMKVNFALRTLQETEQPASQLITKGQQIHLLWQIGACDSSDSRREKGFSLQVVAWSVRRISHTAFLRPFNALYASQGKSML